MSISDDVLAMTFSSDQSPSLSIDGMLMDSQTIASVLREAKNRPKVKELTLRNVTLDDTVAKAAEELFHPDSDRQWTKIETIHCTGYPSRIIQATLPKTQQLAFTGSVPIAHNPRYCLEASSLQALGNALKECKNLKTLSIKGTRLGQPGFEVFCSGLAQSDSLQTLQMSHCALDVPEVDMLGTALEQNQHLISLSLAHCKWGTSSTTSEESTEHFDRLLESLVHHPALECLNVYGMYCTPRAIRALSDMLRAPHSKLWHLGLKNNLRHPEDKLQVTNLIRALEGNKALTYLQISGDNFDDDDMELLAQVITTANHTLTALSLTANNIGDDGILSFARRLPEMKALRYLDVQRNPFTDVSKKEIVDALKDNVELERLDLDGTWDPTKSFYLRLNKGGRRLLLAGNNTPLGLWPLVLARANQLPFGRNCPFAHLDVLYCLVKGPALFQTTTRKRTAAVTELPSQNGDSKDGDWPKAKKVRLNGDR